LSFAILAEYFPKEMSGRANAALNLLHVGAAFVLQSATGFIIEQWPQARGAYPAEAHQLAMAATLVLQLAAFAWSALPTRRQPIPAMAHAASRSLNTGHACPASATLLYAAALAWTQRVKLVRRQAADWCFAAAASMMLCISLPAALAATIGRPAVAVHILEVDRLAGIQADYGRSSSATWIDSPAALEQLRTAQAMASAESHAIGFVRPEPIVRSSPAMLASNVRAHP
jgi:hypothetical protein